MQLFQVHFPTKTNISFKGTSTEYPSYTHTHDPLVLLIRYLPSPRTNTNLCKACFRKACNLGRLVERQKARDVISRNDGIFVILAVCKCIFVCLVCALLFLPFLLDMSILFYVIVVIVYVFFIQRGQYFGETNLAKENEREATPSYGIVLLDRFWVGAWNRTGRLLKQWKVVYVAILGISPSFVRRWFLYTGSQKNWVIGGSSW